MELREDQFKDYEKGNSFMYYNHIEITRFDPAGCEVKVELQLESMNLHGMVHGGLFCSMADCVAGMTARANGGDFVTQSMHINFLSNVKGDVVFAKALPVKIGRSLSIFRVEVTDAAGKLLCDCTVDMFRIHD